MPPMSDTAPRMGGQRVFQPSQICGEHSETKHAPQRRHGMNPELFAYRRVLIKAYQHYLSADRSLQIATRKAEDWMRVRPERGILLIGDPGSPIRQLHEKRDRALARLQRTLEFLREAELNYARRAVRKPASRGVRLIGYVTRIDKTGPKPPR